MFKLFAFDIDGTILPFGQTALDPQIITMFKRLKKTGAITAFVTGRELISIGDFINTPNVDYFIGANGAFIYDIKNKKMLFETTVSYNEIHQLLVFCDKHQINYNVISATSVYYKDKTEFQDHWFWKDFYDDIKPITDLNMKKEDIHQLTLTAYNDEDKSMLVEFIKTIPNLQTTSVWTNGLFVGPYGINKSKGLEILGNHLNITLEDMIAFGDSENDIEMLETVGLSFAVENAEPIVKSVAHEIIGSVTEYGVLKKLEAMKII